MKIDNEKVMLRLKYISMLLLVVFVCQGQNGDKEFSFDYYFGKDSIKNVKISFPIKENTTVVSSLKSKVKIKEVDSLIYFFVDCNNKAYTLNIKRSFISEGKLVLRTSIKGFIRKKYYFEFKSGFLSILVVPTEPIKK